MEILLPLIIPVITGLLCRIIRSHAAVERLNALGATATLAAALALAVRVFTGGPVTAFDGRLYVDALSAFLITMIVIVGFLVAWYSVGYLRRDLASGEVPENQVGWYYLGLHGFIWTMLVTTVIDDLGLLVVAVEATTLVSALLVGFYRTKAALEAAWKYLILCTVGITFALLGVLLTYYASVQSLGEHAGLSWTYLVAHAQELDPGLMRLAFVFLLIGLGTKAGFAPLHAWLPDAHSQAPSPVSALLSGVLLKCGLYAILRFHLVALQSTDPYFSPGLLLGFGLLSVVVAVPFILTQRDLKRMLAYSSVEHLGLIAAAIGLGGPLGLYAGLLHMFNHAMAKALLFFVAGNLRHRYGTTQMVRIRGVLQAMPVTGTLLILGIFAILGIPPAAIFASEFAIVGAGFARGSLGPAILIVIALAIVFAGAWGHILPMAFGRARNRLAPSTLGPFGVVAVAVPATFILLFGVYVPPPVSLIAQKILLLFGEGGL